MRRLAAPAVGLNIVLALALLLASAVPARAWSPEMHQRVAEQAGRLMPVSLQHVLAQNLSRLREGAVAPLSQQDFAHLRAGQDGRRGSLEQVMVNQVQRVLDLLAQRAPMNTVMYEMGVLSHYVTLANDPTIADNADPREADWADDFERYTEARMNSFRMVFDGYYSPSLAKDDVPGFVGECKRRAGRHYPVLSMMWVKGDGSIARGDFDDRHPVYGVAALTTAHAIGDTAKLWIYIWLRSNGDTTSLPFPQGLQVGPAVGGEP